MCALFQDSDSDANDAERDEGEAVTEAESENYAKNRTAAESAAEVFEHLARIRSGISEGVITPW